MSLSGPSATGRFSVLGYDRDGFSTWVEPRDVTLDYDRGVIDVVPDGTGFRIVPLLGDSATPITIGSATSSPPSPSRSGCGPSSWTT